MEISAAVELVLLVSKKKSSWYILVSKSPYGNKFNSSKLRLSFAHRFASLSACK